MCTCDKHASRLVCTDRYSLEYDHQVTGSQTSVTSITLRDCLNIKIPHHDLSWTRSVNVQSKIDFHQKHFTAKDMYKMESQSKTHKLRLRQSKWKSKFSQNTQSSSNQRYIMSPSFRNTFSARQAYTYLYAWAQCITCWKNIYFFSFGYQRFVRGPTPSKGKVLHASKTILHCKRNKRLTWSSKVWCWNRGLGSHVINTIIITRWWVL